jgi:hypothetical protein
MWLPAFRLRPATADAPKRFARRRAAGRPLVVALLLTFVVGSDAQAQGRGRAGGAGQPPQSGRAAAAQDLVGYWVSVVAEHWHLRMLVPPKGDFSMLPLNAEARKIANAWDPAKEVAGGEQCKSYGAAAIMRVPGRLHIHWADDNTLQMDIDSGTQTRFFRFGATVPPGQALQWQGYSVATWESTSRDAARRSAHLKVTTTRMRSGYLRRNGVPYSENATLQEYFDRFTEPNGDEWLVVDSILTDPQYLTQPYLTSTAFKKIPDRSGWDPTPCRADQAR